MGLRLAMYQEALSDFPAWAIDEARRRWMKADAGDAVDRPNYAFAPSPPQLVQIARALVEREQRHARRMALPAPEPTIYRTPEEIAMRERAAEAIKAAAGPTWGIGKGFVENKHPQRPDAEVLLTETMPSAFELEPSPELLALMAKKSADQVEA